MEELIQWIIDGIRMEIMVYRKLKGVMVGLGLVVVGILGRREGLGDRWEVG